MNTITESQYKRDVKSKRINVLNNFIIDRNSKTLKDLKGKISFRDDYDYKAMRS